MERIALLLSLVTTLCLLLNADKHLWKKVYKPYGVKMCGEVCRYSKRTFIYHKEDLSCQKIPTNFRSKGKLSVGDCLEHSLDLVEHNDELIQGDPSCVSGETNLLHFSSENNHLNHTMLLHAACKEGRLCPVQHILSQGLADINCRGKLGQTPVQTAAKYGQTAVFDYLVTEGCDLTAVNDNNNTALHIACAGGSTDKVRRLVVDMKHDVDSKGWNGYTPVMFASYFGQVEVFDLLLREGCDTDSMDFSNDTLLHVACHAGKVNMVKHILELNLINIDIKGEFNRTPVLVAAQRGHIPVVDFLISEHCNINVRDNQGNNLLHLASLFGTVDMVEYIVEHKAADIDSRGHIGRTPVIMAASMGRRGIVDLLFNKNCAITAVDDNKDNILHLACSSGHVNMVQHILKLDVIDIDSKGFIGRTAVMMATRFAHKEVVRLLISKNCDLDIVDNEGNNIVHLACKGGDIDTVRDVLTLSPGTLKERNKQGVTPRQLPEQEGQWKIVSLLKGEGY